MATHSQNIEALRTAVYGEQVRGAMIELFDEDYAMVKKGVGVGTDVTSSSSPVTGYVDGNVYINSETLDIWKTDGSVWDNKGNLKGIADIEVDESTEDAGENVVTITLTNGTSKTFSVLNGSKGSTGVSIVNAVDDGQGKFHLTKSDGTNTAQIQTVKGDKGDKGDTGATGQTGATGRGVTSITSSDAGKNHTLSANFTDGTSSIITTLRDGADGEGGGDMYKSTYDVNDNGIVDYAEGLKDSLGNTMTYADVANKVDPATTLAGYGITDAYTDSEVDALLDEKIVVEDVTADLDIDSDKVLGLSSAVTSKLSHIEESDAWVSTKSTYKSNDVVIYNNSMYAVKDNISAVPVGTLPTNTTYYEPYSISALKSSLANLSEQYPHTSLTLPIEGSSANGNMCERKGNIVTISANVYNLNEIPNNLVVATVPENYRPYTRVKGMAVMTIISGHDEPFITTLFDVTADGNVTINYSSSLHISGVRFAITYSV